MICRMKKKITTTIILFALTGAFNMANSTPLPAPVPGDSLPAAIMASNRGDYEKALSIMNKLVEKNPSSWELYMNRSSVYLKLKDPKQALNDINKAFVLLKLPENKKSRDDTVMYSAALYNRACVYMRLGKDIEAIPDLVEAVSVNHFFPAAHYQLGDLYTKQGKLDLALQNYKTSKSLSLKLGQDLEDLDKKISEIEAKKKQAKK